MKKLISLALGIVAISSINMAECSPQFYIKAEAGGAIPANNTLRKAGKSADTLLGLAIGAKFNKGFRSDLNLRYKNPSWHLGNNSLSLKQYTILLNMYYDFSTHNMFTPYVAGGIGYMIGKTNIPVAIPGTICPTLPAGPPCPIGAGPSTSQSKFNLNGFAWNIGVGSKAKLSESAELDLSYRFLIVPKFPSNVPQAYRNLAAHEVTLGLLYNF